MAQDTDEKQYVQIRSPSLQETLVIPFDPSSTIADLKRNIRAAHPNKPLAQDQRIIFRGNVLADTQVIAALITNMESVATFHLVVKPSINTTPTTTPPIATNPTTPQPTAPPASFVSPAPAAPLTSPPVQPSMLVPGGYQIVALNGHYYLAPVLVPSISNDSPNVHLTAAGRMAYSQPILQPSPSTNPQEQPAPQPQQPQQPQQQPAEQVQARPARAMQRGATVWLALKLMFALFVTCQGASIDRVILFHVLAVVFFMYQTGRFRLAIHRVTPEEMQRILQQNFARAMPDPVHPNPQPTQEQQADRPGDPSHPATHQEDNSRLSSLNRGMYTFVASLWPSYGRDPRIAQAFDNAQENEMDEL
ncbi:hypothetical protein DM01DRAFT_1408443 [Hesseltinella vesiculosa]|uniref:Ubiquitin-like domain-containing protein n=1 Tax=Hesseltinella vesiculosa TaxID=101127 RepID=A0A1X2GEL0_9FUNG|nr:hypothetical protein DM01DRAFT_1408443 [Hesseltinella vesiculosa]